MQSTFIWLCIVACVHCCTPGVDPKTGTENYFGGTFKLETMPDGRTGEPIMEYQEATCTFDQTCRWGNQARGGGDSQWYLATGTANEGTWRAEMGNDQQPTPPYALIPISTTSTDANIDWYVSERYNCAKPFLMMAFNYWTSPGISFQVCAIRDGTETKLWCSETINRQSDPSSPGPYLLEHNEPTNEPFRLAFIPSAGTFGHIAIDEIQVYSEDFCPPTTPAPTTTTFPTTIATTTPVPTTAAGGITSPPRDNSTECRTIPCDFEAGLCPDYDPNDSRGGKSYIGVYQMQPQIGTSQTTKVLPDKEGKIGDLWLGAEVSQGQLSVLELPRFTVTKPRSLQMRFYQATYAGRIRVCYDSNLSNCEVVDPDANANTRTIRDQWRDWTSDYAMRPENGENRVFIVTDLNANSATGTGIGVDNFDLTGCN